MKHTILKTLILMVYVATLVIVNSIPELLDGFSHLFVIFILAYCGIIVLSQLVSTLVALCHRCVAAKGEYREEDFAVPSVVFETESEAT